MQVGPDGSYVLYCSHLRERENKEECYLNHLHYLEAGWLQTHNSTNNYEGCAMNTLIHRSMGDPVVNEARK